jgi:hypothetical protein
MPRPTNKAQLIEDSWGEYEALEGFLAALTSEQMTQPGILDEWSVKDVLAHLYEWQQMFFRWYEAGLRGEIPAVPAEGYKWSQTPALNEKIYEQYRARPLPEVLELFRASHQETIKLIESLPESDLFTAGLYAWMNQNNLSAYLKSTAGSHYRWARKEMRNGMKLLSIGETQA